MNFDAEIERQKADVEALKRKLPQMSPRQAMAEFNRLVESGNTVAFRLQQELKHSADVSVKGMNWEKLDGQDVEMDGAGNVQDWPGLPRQEDPLLARMRRSRLNK